MPVAILMLLLPALKAGFEFLTALLAFLATTQGQAVVVRWLENDAALRAGLGQIGGWLKRLFTGQLITFDADMLKRTTGT